MLYLILIIHPPVPARTFRSPLINLQPNTTYYYRAFASNAAGDSYGTEYILTTSEIYTTTITFPVQNINDSGDTIQVILVFTHNLTGTNRNWTSEEKNLLISKHGELDISYNLDDPLLVPGSLSMEISDEDGVLDDLFFGSGTIALATYKQALLTIKINGVEKYSGNCIEDTIKSNTGTRIISFTVAPKTDLIVKRELYNTENKWTNPFSFTPTSYYSVIEILENIFHLVNPSISYLGGSLELIHNWQFQGKGEGVGNFINDIMFQELYQMIDPLFFDNSFGLTNCGDLLKKLAIDWGAFTGMVGNNKAFFKQLFHYNAGNVQTVSVYAFQKAYRYGLIDYVNFSTNIGGPNEPYEEGIYTELADRYIERTSLPGFFITSGSSGTNIKSVISRLNYFVFNHGSTISSPPDEGTIYSNNGSTFQVMGTVIATSGMTTTSYVSTKRVSGIDNPTSSGTLTLVSGTGPGTITYSSVTNADDTYDIYQARLSTLLNNSFADHGKLSANFWYTYRGNIQNCRVDKFIFNGIDYDFLKDFEYAGNKYQPISMKFYYAENKVECEAIFLGDTGYPNPFN